MAATTAQFLVEFPEFAGADPALVAAKLAAVALEVDVTAMGALADQLTYYLTARKLALMPGGNSSKLVRKDGSTVYDDEIKRLRRVMVGPVVAT